MTTPGTARRGLMDELDLHVTGITLLFLVLVLLLGSDRMLGSLPGFENWQFRLLWVFIIPQGRLLTKLSDQAKNPSSSAWRYFLINELQVLIAAILLLGYLSL